MNNVHVTERRARDRRREREREREREGVYRALENQEALLKAKKNEKKKPHQHLG